jgi:hypothetical protein
MDNIPMKNSALVAIAAKRLAQEAGTKSDPIIKRTQTTDPDTGAVTYRQSWSDTSTNTSAKRTNASPSISSVGSKAKSSKTATSGSREITSAPIPKAAEEKKQEISAPLMKKEDKFTPKSKKEKVIENKISDYNKNKTSDESFDQYRKRIQERANINSEKAKSSNSGGSLLNNKNKDTSCKTC